VAELVVLSLDRVEFLALHRTAAQGNRAAIEAIASIWAPYRETELACFLCDRAAPNDPVTGLPRALMLPENQVYEKLIAAPLCQDCFDLPLMLRLSRCLKVLKKMYSKKTGKNITFSINHHRSPHPR
jgi:hypothetical protein